MTFETATATLSEYDFIVCIDASGSMAEPVSSTNTQTRWNFVQETAVQFTRDICQIDTDGIGLVVFAGLPGGLTVEDHCNIDKLKAAFATRQPRGSTPLAEALAAAVNLAKGSSKKKFVLVFTDGVPDDQSAAAKVIIEQANSQVTDDAFTFAFVQVGDDKGAAAYLKKLDDDLTGAKFDIVSAYTLDEANAFPSTAELVLHAIDN